MRLNILFRKKGEKNLSISGFNDNVTFAMCWIYIFENKGEGYNHNEREITWT